MSVAPLFEVDCGGEYFDEDLAIAELLYNGVCFVNIRKYLGLDSRPLGMTVVVFALCNDAFAYACADAEEIDDVEALWRAWNAAGDHGVVRWIASKRRTRPLPQIERWMREDGSWTPELDALPTWGQRP